MDQEEELKTQISNIPNERRDIKDCYKQLYVYKFYNVD